MKTLIVPTDFSPASVNAMKYAVDMATEINAGIVLLNAYDIPLTYTDVPVPAITVDEVKRMSISRLEDLKASIIRLSAGKIEVFIEARLSNPVTAIEELCESVKPFAVVMGSHGSTGIAHLLMGSTSLEAIRRLKYPVIVIPPGSSFRNIKKIGLACDFKDITESIPFEYIKNIVHEFNGELHVIHIGEREQESPIDTAWFEAELDDIRPTYHFIKADDVVEGINDFAEASGLDLVTVIPRHHRFAERLFQKSKSRELLKQTHIPIVAIHE